MISGSCSSSLANANRCFSPPDNVRSHGDRLMEMLIGELPHAAILSVGHRVELEAFHSRKITLEKRDGGARLVSDVDLIPRKKKKRNVLSRLVRNRRRRLDGGTPVSDGAEQ